MAESVFKHVVTDRGLSHRFSIESAGTANYHLGENPDHRCIKTLAHHGIDDYSKARQVKESDLVQFDLVLAMDHSNLMELEALAMGPMEHIQLFRTFDPVPGDFAVPDPYYGELKDFEEVYDMVLRTSEALLEHLVAQQ